MDNDERLREYAEIWGNLRDLLGTPGWETFLDRLRYEYQERSNRVASGRLSSEEYVRECGILEGLNLASSAIERTREEYETLLALEAEEKFPELVEAAEAVAQG